MKEARTTTMTSHVTAAEPPPPPHDGPSTIARGILMTSGIIWPTSGVM